MIQKIKNTNIKFIIWQNEFNFWIKVVWKSEFTFHHQPIFLKPDIKNIFDNNFKKYF